jgi:hypothetical protein
MLGVLRHEWAPGAFVVSFKLETDETILLDKVGWRGGGSRVLEGHRAAALRHQTPGAAPVPASLHQVFAPPLTPQAAGAVERYGVHAVVANLLHTRKDRVLIVHSGEQPPSGGAAAQASPAAAAADSADGPVLVSRHRGLEVADMRRPAGHEHIEHTLVGRVVALHRDFQRQRTRAAA